jgi:hypothetical protein
MKLFAYWEVNDGTEVLYQQMPKSDDKNLPIMSVDEVEEGTAFP